jgi:transcription elongation factor Elf1
MSIKYNPSGYICPFSGEDCLYLDSLSMIATVICKHCGIYILEKKMGNAVKISDPYVQLPLGILSINNKDILN